MRYADMKHVNIARVAAPERERFCVIDFETNGLWGNDCEVIEFAAVKIANGEMTTQITALCEPSAPLSPFITKLTGIKSGMVIGKPRFEQYLQSFVDYIGDDIIVAHNAPFDLGILTMYCERARVEFNPRVLCTLASARGLFPDFPNHRLQTLDELFSLNDDRAHRALADTKATARLLLLMFEYIKTGAF